MLHSQTSHCAALAGNARIRVGLIPAYKAAVHPAVNIPLNVSQNEPRNATFAKQHLTPQGPTVNQNGGEQENGVAASNDSQGGHAFTVQHGEVAKYADIARRSRCGHLDARLGHIYGQHSRPHHRARKSAYTHNS